MNEERFLEAAFEVLAGTQFNQDGIMDIRVMSAGLRYEMDYQDPCIHLYNDETGEEWRLEFRKVR